MPHNGRMRPPVAGQDFDLPEFAPAEAVATMFGRPYRTVQTWAARGIIRHQVVRGVLLVATLEFVREHHARRESPDRRGPRKRDGASLLTDSESPAS